MLYMDSNLPGYFSSSAVQSAQINANLDTLCNARSDMIGPYYCKSVWQFGLNEIIRSRLSNIPPIDTINY